MCGKTTRLTQQIEECKVLVNEQITESDEVYCDTCYSFLQTTDDGVFCNRCGKLVCVSCKKMCKQCHDEKQLNSHHQVTYMCLSCRNDCSWHKSCRECI